MKDQLAAVEGSGAYRRVEAKRVIEAPIERVWEAITDADEVAKWWDPGVIEKREGGRIRLGANADECAGGLPLDGEVKVFLPPHVFEFTWNQASIPAQGVVRFDLVELEGGRTLVTLTDFVTADDLLHASVGWHSLLDQLADHARGVPLAPPSEARLAEMYARYQEALQRS